MTLFAPTPPALSRFFQRLDSAPHPQNTQLQRVLLAWQTARSGVIYPAPASVDLARLDPSERTGFVFEAIPGSRDYVLRSGAEALEPLLGQVAAGDRLTAAPRRRAAVLLRRLLDFVGDRGEPVLGTFSAPDRAGLAAAVEIVLAPLSEDGRTVDAVLGGVAMSPPEARLPSSFSGRTHSGSRRMIFALGTSAAFGRAVADEMGIDVAPHEERTFEDREFKVRPLVDVADREVYVIDSLDGDATLSANDKLCRMLFFIAALKDAGARRVNAVAPYMCYARKDRRTKSRDPVTLRYVAQLFEAVGTDRVITMEAHNPAAFENAFRCPTVLLSANELFARHFAQQLRTGPVAVVSPDVGGSKRAESFRELLETELGRPVSKGIMDKQRSGGVVSGELFAGDVEGHAVIIVDDLISAGTTMAKAAHACKERGATQVLVAATHGLFVEGARTLWAEPAVDAVVVTDTIRHAPDPSLVNGRLTVLSATQIFATAMSGR